MAWQLYRWIWQLRSPLYIGIPPAGSLNRTRLYIPARAIWGALTAEVARRGGGNTFPDYQAVGQELKRKARFTYLYPAEQVSNHWLGWLPRYESEYGLRWHREDENIAPIPDRLFRMRLLDTRPGTAIAAGTGAAEDGTLREVECIQPHWRSNPMSSVAFVGYLFLHASIDPGIENALKAVQELYLGGETRYGFGHLSLLPHSSQDPWEHARDCFGTQVNLTQNDPLVENPHHLLAHAFQDYDPAEKGAWELLVQWDWGTFQSLESPLWVPGSLARSDARFVILDSGVWQAQK